MPLSIGRFDRRMLMLVAFTCFATGIRADALSSAALERLAQPGHVLLLRHANAPGVGDPPGMDLSECSTQRNLDNAGRAHAKQLGVRLREAGIRRARIYTSQWCRCRETARLLDVGEVHELPALNSTFGRAEQKESQIRALREFIDTLPRNDMPVVLVTHQITITALTGDYPSSGDGLIVRLLPSGGFERLAESSAE
jgi:phosphohistidine phosphatase SixA